MRDYWLTKDLLQATGIAFIVLSLIGVALALWLPKKWWGKLLAVIAVAFVISLPVREAKKDEQQQQVVVDDYKVRYATAKALFEKRCETAGEKIYKKVENVEGIQLLNLRSGDIAENRANQNWEGAALPNDATGDGYIENFLSWERNDSSGARGQLTTVNDKAFTKGYRYVDVSDTNGSFKRYRFKEPNNSDLVNELVKGSPARYAVGFVSQMNPEDRVNWVAGTTIKITDTQTGEVMGERTSYAFEPGLGNTSGGRSPWGFAVTCPTLRGWQERYPTRFFVDQVLHPKQGT